MVSISTNRNCLFRRIAFARSIYCNPSPSIENWDLAICLEVAEHLFPNRAKGLIKDLAKAAPIILFSAAVPGQADRYTSTSSGPGIGRTCLPSMTYVRLDLIRPLIWQDPRVNWWYQQNVYLFAGPEALRHSTALRATVETAADPQLELLNEAALYRLTSLSGIVRELLPATGKMVANRWRRLKNNRG